MRKKDKEKLMIEDLNELALICSKLKETTQKIAKNKQLCYTLFLNKSYFELIKNIGHLRVGLNNNFIAKSNIAIEEFYLSKKASLFFLLSLNKQRIGINQDLLGAERSIVKIRNVNNTNLILFFFNHLSLYTRYRQNDD